MGQPGRSTLRRSTLRRSTLAAMAVGALLTGCATVQPTATAPAGGRAGQVVAFSGAEAPGAVHATPPDGRDTRVLPSSTTPTPPWHASGRRPNILLITADDASILDLPWMPHVRKLIGSHGVTFADAIAPTPICVPARASLLTGQYAHNHGAVTISGPRGGFPAFRDTDTVPVALQRNGYATLFTGKYLNGYGDHDPRYVPPGWTDWRGLAIGTYDFFNQTVNVNGRLVPSHRYSTFTVRDQADQLIRQHRGHKPWYLWVNYVAPHVGAPVQRGDPMRIDRGTNAAYQTTVPAPSDFNRYAGIHLPRRPDMFERDTRDKPRISVARHRLDARQKAAMRIVFERRIEAVRGVDRAVASQIRVLRRTHQLANTVVMFTSDNGYVTGEHNYDGKLWHYNEILRIPALMRGPGVPRHQVVRTAITNPDIAATILALARTTSLRPLDGVDMMPWLNAPTQLRVIPIEGWAVHNGRQQRYTGVRVGKWTYIRYHRGAQEMYDRSWDPYELHSLQRRPAWVDQLHQLQRLTRKYHACRANTCPKAFYPVSPSRS
ncbi:sulfatase-like hydrolase/transferase [Nocardioides terrisoli]|uniref:sulfatase-like hydrolase/transferase n=1 Tax=Nocardioides terrisoli TaxID=3388267 RepID=UPI00287BC7BD|nr:sulfatase-like hydrolase/transferase [Nocardioides marmorisolisilvae]